MSKTLFLAFILFSFVLSDETIHGPEFEKKFQVEHMKEGDGKTFP